MLLSLEKAICSCLGHYVGESTMGTKTAEYICMRLVKSSKQNVPPVCFTPCSDAGELGRKSSKEDATPHEHFHYFFLIKEEAQKGGERLAGHGKCQWGSWAALRSVTVCNLG